jgi:hypothetical protein
MLESELLVKIINKLSMESTCLHGFKRISESISAWQRTKPVTEW